MMNKVVLLLFIPFVLLRSAFKLFESYSFTAKCDVTIQFNNVDYALESRVLPGFSLSIEVIPTTPSVSQKV